MELPITLPADHPLQLGNFTSAHLGTFESALTFSRYGAFGYDIVVDDVTGASGLATIPGSVMNDRFSVEVYTRNDQGQP